MSVTKTNWGDHELYTIGDARGAHVTVSDLGALIQSIVVPDRNGVLADVVAGYNTPEEYIENDGYFGAFVGRYANRIAGASFSLNGREYGITANEGGNTLHGGKGLSNSRFDMICAGESSVTFGIVSPDGSDGFPGRLDISVTYSFSEDNELKITYDASTDADTPVNLTNHSYFNLAGSGDILSHELMINAPSYLPVDDELIPTGEIRPVEGTEFDFRKMRRIENGYYDHCFVLAGGICARLYDAASGREMTVTTDMPGVQFYAGGATTHRRGKNGAVYDKNSALCLETQMFPDSPNRPSFPNTVLKAGEKYHSETKYRFTVK